MTEDSATRTLDCPCGFTRIEADLDAALGCPECKLGSRENPHKVMPPAPERIPYGEFCVCVICGYINRSTMIFDYYGTVDELLKCETCQMEGHGHPGAAMPRHVADMVYEKTYTEAPDVQKR